MILLWILGSTILVSAISLIGVFTLSIKKEVTLEKILLILIGFAAGTLIGDAFLHLLPESLEHISAENTFFWTLTGFTLFFLLERYLFWHHCHEGVCEVHTFTYLNLIGDGVHNFLDGLIIAASFTADLKVGLATTLAVIFHEIPQEMGDFGILLYGGFSKTKALFFNLACALTAIIGALLGYLLTGLTDRATGLLLPFTAGGFIYIASADLLPELHKQSNRQRANFSFLAFLAGILFMWFLKD